MFLFPAIACLSATLCWWIHTFLGQSVVADSLTRSDLHPFPKTTLEACWHAITLFLALIAIAAGVAASPEISPDLRHYLLVTVILGTGPFAFIFLALSQWRFKSYRVMPQTFLLLPIALLAGGFWLWPLRVDASVAIGSFLALALLLLGLVHIAWAQGITWPAKSTEELTELVVGQRRNQGFPGKGLTFLVAAFFCLLATAQVVVILKPDLDLFGRGLQWFVLALFALRGLGGFFEPMLRPWTRELPYGHWNRVLYSPLCLLMALSAAGLLYGTG